MSSMIQKTENTAAIADYIARLLNMGFDTNGMSAPETLGRELDRLGCNNRGYFEESKIFEALVNLNYTAYLGRYPEQDAEPVPEYKRNDISARAEYTHGEPDANGYYNEAHFVISEWHYKIYKIIQFFNYQCSEDATENNALYKAMNDLETALAKFIVANTAIYAAQRWE